MPVAGASGIHLKASLRVSRSSKSETPLGGRRAADVAEANKQNAGGLGAHAARRSRARSARKRTTSVSSMSCWLLCCSRAVPAGPARWASPAAAFAQGRPQRHSAPTTRYQLQASSRLSKHCRSMFGSGLVAAQAIGRGLANAGADVIGHGPLQHPGHGGLGSQRGRAPSRRGRRSSVHRGC